MIYAVISLEEKTGILFDNLSRIRSDITDGKGNYDARIKSVFQDHDTKHICFVAFDGSSGELATALSLEILLKNVRYLIIPLDNHNGRGSADLANWIDYNAQS